MELQKMTQVQKERVPRIKKKVFEVNDSTTDLRRLVIVVLGHSTLVGIENLSRLVFHVTSFLFFYIQV